MKNLCFLGLFLLGLCSGAFAQRFGIIDSEKILEKMPEYSQAKSDLDRLVQTWQSEIEAAQKKLIQMRLSLEAEKVLFTEEMIKKKETDMNSEEEKLRSQQSTYFGFEGQLFKKRNELMKPIQDKIFAAAQKIARKKGLSFIFDRSGDMTLIYADATHDYTDFVMEELGLNRKDAKTDPKKDAKNDPKNKNKN